MKTLNSYRLVLASVLMAAWAAWAAGAAGVARADSPAFTYSVPVKPRLVAYATFPLKDAAFGPRADGKLGLDFDLPEDLVGRKPMHISLTQAPGADDGALHLEGDIGTATCPAAAPGSETLCRVEYRIKHPYTIGVIRLLLRKYLFHRGFFKRVTVALKFSGDPVGFVHIRQP